jgi:hypothetical protein
LHNRVLLRGCTEKALRGVPADITIMDEAELISDDAIATGMGNLSGNVNKFVLVGTPPKIDLSGKFQKVITNPSKYNFKLFQWSKYDCSWHTVDELENNKLNLGTEEYLTEVLGQPLTDEQKGLFEAKHIKACTYPSVIPETGACESGIDSGGTGNRDKYALCIIQRVGTRCKVRLVKFWNFETIDQTPEAVRDYLVEYNTVLNKMDSQPEEFYIDLQAITKKKIFPVNMKMYREEALGHLKYLIKTHKLEIDASEEELLKQLYRFTKKAGHDDCLVWALALACYENKELFPIKAATDGRMTIVNYNTGDVFSNFNNKIAVKPNNYGRHFSAIPVTNKKPIFDRRR